MGEWTWVFNQGLAVAIVIGIAWAGYHSIRWAASELFVPLKNAAVTHLETVGNTLTEASETLKTVHQKLDGVNEQTTALLKSNHELIKSHEGFLFQSLDDRRNLHTRLNEVTGRVEKLEERNA